MEGEPTGDAVSLKEVEGLSSQDRRALESLVQSLVLEPGVTECNVALAEQ